MIKTFLHSTVGSIIITAIVTAVPWLITQNGLETISIAAVLRGAITWLKLQTA